MTDLTLISLKDDFLEKAGDRPPLGIMYIAGFLEKYGYDVKILDLNYDDLVVDSPVCGISFSTPLFQQAHKVAFAIKKNKKIRIIAGGAHCNAFSKEEGNPVDYRVFDQAIVGDGEIPMLNIMRGESDYKKYFSKRKENLDIYTLPARHLVDMKRYNMGTLISSRGCSGNCIFCNSPGIGFGFHSPERTTFEMQLMEDKYGYKELYFHDDTFTLNYQRVENICDLIQKKSISAKSRINARVDTVDENLIRKMADANINTISFGFEHADNNVLLKCGKGKLTVEDYEKVINWCHMYGINVYGYFILNLPGATEETARKTIQWAKDMKVTKSAFYPLVAFPGTSVWKYGNKMGLIVKKNYGYFQAGKEEPKLNVENPQFLNKDVLKLLGELKCGN